MLPAVSPWSKISITLGCEMILRALSLATKALAHSGVACERRLHYFYRARPIVERLAGPVHRRHAPFADDCLDDVSAGKHSPDQRIARFREFGPIDEAIPYVGGVSATASGARLHRRLGRRATMGGRKTLPRLSRTLPTLPRTLPTQPSSPPDRGGRSVQTGQARHGVAPEGLQERRAWQARRACQEGEGC